MLYAEQRSRIFPRHRSEKCPGDQAGKKGKRQGGKKKVTTVVSASSLVRRGSGFEAYESAGRADPQAGGFSNSLILDALGRYTPDRAALVSFCSGEGRHYVDVAGQSYIREGNDS